MISEFFDNDPTLMRISELLKIFNLNLNLSQQVLDLYVDVCLKEGNLTIKEDGYIFRYDDYSVTIYPSNFNTTVIESQETNPSGELSSCCCYNSRGFVTRIN